MNNETKDDSKWESIGLISLLKKAEEKR